MELMIVLALIAVLAVVGGIVEESARTHKKAPGPIG
jgi:Tfp pilus assembly protein PilE